MASLAFVVAKDVLSLKRKYFETVMMVKWQKHLFWCEFSYAKNRLYSVINFDHVKLRYIEPCNFPTKRALVSQQSALVVVKDPNISHYLNVSIYLPTIIFAIT